jgi:hypothetical protein
MLKPEGFNRKFPADLADVAETEEEKTNVGTSVIARQARNREDDMARSDPRQFLQFFKVFHISFIIALRIPRFLRETFCISISVSRQI